MHRIGRPGGVTDGDALPPWDFGCPPWDVDVTGQAVSATRAGLHPLWATAAWFFNRKSCWLKGWLPGMEIWLGKSPEK